jgi:hypothetical protein
MGARRSDGLDRFDLARPQREDLPSRASLAPAATEHWSGTRSGLRRSCVTLPSPTGNRQFRLPPTMGEALRQQNLSRDSRLTQRMTISLLVQVADGGVYGGLKSVGISESRSSTSSVQRQHVSTWRGNPNLTSRSGREGSRARNSHPAARMLKPRRVGSLCPPRHHASWEPCSLKSEASAAHFVVSPWTPR